MRSNELFGLPDYIVEKIHTIFAKHSEIQSAVIYGSRAKGNYKFSSDIDLCLEGENINLTQLFKIETQLDELLLPWKIDLTLKNKIDNQNLLDHIEEVGILFYRGGK